MNQLRVANQKERLLFENTIRNDLNKIPNVNSNVFGVQTYSPIIPNNPHNNMHGSSYHKMNSDRNHSYNYVLPQENQPNYNRIGNHVHDNINLFKPQQTPQVNTPQNNNQHSYINNYNNQNNQNNNTNNNLVNQITYNNLNDKIITPQYQQQIKKKTKRDSVWEMKKQKANQGRGNTMSEQFQSKKIYENEVRYDIETPNKNKETNKLDNYTHLNNNVYSGAPKDQIKRTSNSPLHITLESPQYNQQLSNKLIQQPNYYPYEKMERGNGQNYEEKRKTPFNNQNLPKFSNQISGGSSRENYTPINSFHQGNQSSYTPQNGYGQSYGNQGFSGQTYGSQGYGGNQTNSNNYIGYSNGNSVNSEPSSFRNKNPHFSMNNPVYTGGQNYSSQQNYQQSQFKPFNNPVKFVS